MQAHSLAAVWGARSKAPSDRRALLCLQAMKERKRCVTAHWLNTVLKKKKLVPPHRALHFPVAFPPGGKPCSQHVRLRPPPERNKRLVSFSVPPPTVTAS